MEAAMEGMMSDMATIWLFSLFALIFNIWIIVVAFKESTGWGIACIIGLVIFPPITLLFGILHWRRAWKPFVGWLVCLAISMFLVFQMLAGFATAAGEIVGEDGQVRGEVQDYSSHLADLVTRGEINDAQRQEELMRYTMSKMLGQSYEKKYPMTATGGDIDLDSIRGESPLDQVDVDAKIDDAIRSEDQMTDGGPQVTRYRAYIEFPFGEASQYLNRRVRISTHKGAQRIGDLIHADENIIRIEQRAHGGNIRYDVEPNEIKKLEYWGWEEY